MRRSRAEAEPASFTLYGELGGRVVSAAYVDGTLHCDERLETQARLLVDLHERWVHCDREIRASLDGGWLPALLTLMRACDRVRETRITLGSPSGVRVFSLRGGTIEN